MLRTDLAERHPAYTRLHSYLGKMRAFRFAGVQRPEDNLRYEYDQDYEFRREDSLGHGFGAAKVGWSVQLQTLSRLGLCCAHS